MPGRIAFSGMLLALPAMFLNYSSNGISVSQAQENPTPSVSGTTADFRVVTDVFYGTQKAPAQQSLTLFSAGVAYDISYDDPNQITMIDPQRSRIVLLNKANKTQTAIDLRQLQQFIDSARKAAETSELAPYLKGADKVAVTDAGVSVGDDVMLYHATMQKPREPQMAKLYAQAADALILLNGLRQGMPPFARLSLNRVVAEQAAVPEEITRTTSSGSQTEVVRCRLHTNWLLSKDDERQIIDIGAMLVNYQQVPTPQFFGALNTSAAVDSSAANQATAKVAGQAASGK